MGEARRRRDREKHNRLNEVDADILLKKCSANNISYYCCEQGAWNHVSDVDTMGFYVYGEPLPEKVVEVAILFSMDPHDLDYHVERTHGWEPHDVGYDEAVVSAAECMMDGGYGVHSDRDRCRVQE